MPRIFYSPWLFCPQYVHLIPATARAVKQIEFYKCSRGSGMLTNGTDLRYVMLCHAGLLEYLNERAGGRRLCQQEGESSYVRIVPYLARGC